MKKFLTLLIIVTICILSTSIYGWSGQNYRGDYRGQNLGHGGYHHERPRGYDYGYRSGYHDGYRGHHHSDQWLWGTAGLISGFTLGALTVQPYYNPPPPICIYEQQTVDCYGRVYIRTFRAPCR